jgi:SAM-dependent methyltransferase
MTNNASTSSGGDKPPDATGQRTAVRERYARIATESSSCGESSSCCDGTGPSSEASADQSRKIGYSDNDLAAVGSAANLGLGCGNPTAIASLEQGDTVLDLGSGGGFDCFLAAREVGTAGCVIGVDMTVEMVETARENIETNDATNAEFRLGEIEHLPVADESVDVIVSNCVVNLSPDKPRVFREAYRVLRPGGRLVVSDVVSTTELPADVRGDPASVAACIGGAASIPALETMLTDAGFTGISIEPKADSGEFIRDWDNERDPSDHIIAAMIEGEKPALETQP